MIVAVDGPAGSGKSTVARRVAERLGVHYLDTGAMYRSVAWEALRTNTSLEDVSAIAEIARRIEIRFAHTEGSAVPTQVFVDGRDATAGIRTPAVDEAVSSVARLAQVRAALVRVQRAEADEGDLVAEGRDIGTVVFPDAEAKVFLTASSEERARRRHVELEARGESVDEAYVLDRMAARDTADSTREEAPLVPAADARIIDTTGMSIDQVVEAVLGYVGEVV